MTGVLLACLAVADEPAEATGQCSCAAASLYALLASAGQAVEVERVSALLPANPQGHSLEDIRLAARQLGVRLVARNLRETHGTLPRAAFIAHLEPQGNAPYGHFLTMRPLDRTARQYQAIDPPKSVDVRTAEEIAEDPRVSGWTLTLAPWWHSPIGAGLASAAVGAIAWGCRSLGRRRTAQRGPLAAPPGRPIP